MKVCQILAKCRTQLEAIQSKLRQIETSGKSSMCLRIRTIWLKTMFVKEFWAVATPYSSSVGAYLLIAFWPGFGYA